MTDDIIKKMEKDIAPKNLDEFYLGMFLAAIVNMMYEDDDEFDPKLFDELLENAETALDYWRNKYEDETYAVVGKTRQGPSRREQKLL